jgi:hypothetical protein
MSTKELYGLLHEWQGVAAVITVLAMGVSAFVVHGRDMQRLDAAEDALHEIKSEAVTRREFDLLMRAIEDLRVDIRLMRQELRR